MYEDLLKSSHFVVAEEISTKKFDNFLSFNPKEYAPGSTAVRFGNIVKEIRDLFITKTDLHYVGSIKDKSSLLPFNVDYMKHSLSFEEIVDTLEKNIPVLAKALIDVAWKNLDCLYELPLPLTYASVWCPPVRGLVDYVITENAYLVRFDICGRKKTNQN